MLNGTAMNMASRSKDLIGKKIKKNNKKKNVQHTLFPN